MKYLKFPDKEQLHVWTPVLASRGDMVEVIVGAEQPALGLAIVPRETEQVPAVETAAITLPNFTLKSAGFGRYNVMDAEGNAVTGALPKVEAQAKLAELNA